MKREEKRTTANKVKGTVQTKTTTETKTYNKEQKTK